MDKLQSMISFFLILSITLTCSNIFSPHSTLTYNRFTISFHLNLSMNLTLSPIFSPHLSLSHLHHLFLLFEAEWKNNLRGNDAQTIVSVTETNISICKISLKQNLISLLNILNFFESRLFVKMKWCFVDSWCFIHVPHAFRISVTSFFIKHVMSIYPLVANRLKLTLSRDLQITQVVATFQSDIERYVIA